MKGKVGLALLATGLATGALVADDVLLTNGEAFEDVIAERDGVHVRIRLEFGELRLPAGSVERIDISRTALSEYLVRREALLSDGGTAREWLDLAEWARSRDLQHSYREALLEAAGIDPALDGLEAGMRRIGYVFEPELDRWMPLADQMRRAGLVRHRGQWVQPEARAAETSPPADEHRDLEQALSRTVELLAMAQLERETRESRESRQTTRTAAAPSYGFPIAYFGGWFFPVAAPGPDAVAEAPEASPPVATLPADLFRRPPGSLLPVGGVNRGTRFRQPGSLIPATSGR